MKKSNLLNSLILAALAAPGVAMAADSSPFSGNVSLTSNYLYRGITQTTNRGAIQGGFDYADPSGIYAGAWGSNISWLTDAGVAGGSLELDTYAGYRAGITDDVSYDVGFLRYNYSGEFAGSPTASTNELYGSIGWKSVTAKYSRSFTNLFGVSDSSGSGYFDLSGSYTIEGPDVTLGAHYGKQNVAGTGNSSLSYADYNVKASKGFGAYTWALMISKTNVTANANKDEKAKAVLSVSHAM